MRIYGEITKIEPQDDGTLKVIGVASSGAVDEADERVSPTAMKAALPDYMRFGALREMHGQSAAGATLGAEVGADGLTRIEAHVVDPLAVKKVRLGVYKGFSIGGRVLERDPADRKLITALKLDEISLVDRPCNPDAVIQMWKADGFAPASGAAAPPGPTNAEVIAKAIELAAAAGRRGRHTEFVVKARQILVDQAAPRAPTVGSGPGMPVMEKVGARNSEADLTHIQAAHDELVALGAQCQPGPGDDDPADIDQIGAPPGASDQAGDMEKLAPPGAPAASAAEASDIGDQLDGLRRSLATLQKRLDEVAAEPLPPRTLAGWARAVSKAEDSAAHDPTIGPDAVRKYLEALTPEERGRLELRAALNRPMPVHGR